MNYKDEKIHLKRWTEKVYFPNCLLRHLSTTQQLFHCRLLVSDAFNALRSALWNKHISMHITGVCHYTSPELEIVRLFILSSIINISSSCKLIFNLLIIFINNWNIDKNKLFLTIYKYCLKIIYWHILKWYKSSH